MPDPKTLYDQELKAKPKLQNWIWLEPVLIIILALLPLLFFWRLVTPNPADRMVIAAGDFTEQYFPLRAFSAQQWVRGQIPLWNPYLYGGQPALADIQSGALYPPHILQALILGWGGPLIDQEIGFPLWALPWQVIAHFALAAVGTYLLGRHLAQGYGYSLRVARSVGCIASLTFTYSGYLTGFPVQQLTILEVSAWLPWAMWALSAAYQPLSRPTRQPAHRFGSLLLGSPAPYWGALAWAMALLAGHPQTVLYIFYLTLAYTMFQAWRVWRSPGSHLWRLAACFTPWLLIILLGTAIAAAQLLPTQEFIARSLRADLSYRAVSAGLPLNELITILYPGFLGGSPEYVGWVALVLVALALTVTTRVGLGRGQKAHGQRQEIIFWAGAGLVGLLLALGGNTFLYPLVYLLLPGFESVRQQERAFLVYSFSAALLAGFGAIVLITPLAKQARQPLLVFERRLRSVALIGLGVTALFIYGSAVSTARGDEVNLFYGVLWHHLFGLLTLSGLLALLALRTRRWLRRLWVIVLLAGWLAFNLFTINWRFNLEKPADLAPFAPTELTQFLQDKLSTNLGRVVSGGFLPGGNSAASVLNLQDLTGNTPLQLAAIDRFLQRMPAWRAWQLLNVYYVVAQRNIADGGLSLVFEAGELKVFEMGDPFPRAWFVAQVELMTDEAQILERLAGDSFDLRRTAIVKTPLDIPVADSAASTLSISDFGPNHLTVVVNTAAPHFLVISQIYDPGWQATLDGQPTRLYQANSILQGVVTPAGTHTIQLHYSPPSFWRGVTLSFIALSVTLLLLGWSSSKKLL
jgi:hypothetical protein